MATILIADDQSPARLELKKMLFALGHDVVAEAESGREAVDLALVLKPDLISAQGEPPYSEAAKAAAPFGPVTKPFDGERIKAVVELALYRSEEGRLRISGERLRQIIDFLPDATFVIDTEGKVVAWNRAIEKLTGIKARDMLGKGDYEYAIPFYGRRRPVLIDLVSRWDTEEVKVYQYVKREGEALVSESYDCLVRPGGTLWNTATLLYDEKGQITGAIESIRDITERKRYEESLRESEERYRSLFEQARDAIVITTEHGEVVDVNTYALNLFGYTKEEMIAMNFQQLYVDPDDGHRFRKEMKERGSAGDFCARLRRSDGSEMECAMNVVCRHGKNGAILGYQGIIRDVTEARRLQVRLQESRKTEAITTLAGGIAHQFNNALTPIMGNIDILQMEHAQDEDLMDTLKQMKESCRRMANLTSQLLAYARGGKYAVQAMAPNAFVLGTIPLVEHTLHPEVRVETDLLPEVSAVNADPTQMEMVLFALIANADEAMEGLGRIRIATANVELDQKLITHHGLTPGPYVCMSVEDTGKGMDEETRQRIFDPFFTTHFLGRGLGMAAVYGIIRNHGGAIEVESELGKGTVVHVYLPAIGPGRKEEGAKGKKKREVEPESLKGTILVIEDDEMVMDLARAMLERLGYRVLAAGTGKEAVDSVKAFEGEIDLALLDIKLPDMSGSQVYPLIMEERPGLKVVVASGYSIDGPAQEILRSGAQGFIQKPFSIEALAGKIREAMES